jgi:hypothetical protein
VRGCSVGYLLIGGDPQTTIVGGLAVAVAFFEGEYVYEGISHELFNSI